MLCETPVGTLGLETARRATSRVNLFDCVKAELSEGLGLVVSWPNKDPVVDTEGQKKRNALELKAMNSILLFSALHQRVEI